MNQNKIHFVPQPVIDIAESLATTKQEHIRVNYIARLEAIRDYCNSALDKNEKYNPFAPHVRQHKVRR